ncbi:ABC transporter ATP-binding protein [Flocculibacter collagenilyticus]|uniref:ABC transporter ATP-binding protein n=1 Tax=Flocculibacter collagenilyticus TaxID=2744479 RepID=UPI0018F5FB61|nr:ABC transporter ATP-binding protein [Flocculibacter collagenilyticus]
MTLQHILSLSEVTFSWPKQVTPTIKIPHLAINQGEKVFIKGASGSGKSTLLSLITGINTPQHGDVVLLGKPISQLPQRKRDIFRADHIGYIFQQFNLLPYLSIIENVMLGCQFSRYREAKIINNGSTLVDEATRLLTHLGLPEALHARSVAELSIGQQQRVAAARALIGSPEILIADEPTSALDFSAREAFMSLLLTECTKSKTSLLFVSHDPTLQHMFDYVIDFAQLNQAAIHTHVGTASVGANAC